MLFIATAARIRPGTRLLILSRSAPERAARDHFFNLASSQGHGLQSAALTDVPLLLLSARGRSTSANTMAGSAP